MSLRLLKINFIACCFLIFFIACTTNKMTNRSAFIVVPEGQMHTLGVQAYGQMKKKAKISTDKKIREAVVRIGKRIAAASGANFKWEFEVFDAPKTINAFCLPGGKIGVYTGILPVAKTEAGLAAVLGHEVAHAILRHGAERMSQGIVTKAGVGLTGIVLGKSKHSGTIMGALGVGAQFGVLLPFSRKHESEADFVGTEYMAKAGYNPRAAVRLWNRMARLSKGKSAPEIMSTHPDPTRRAGELKQNMAKYWKIFQQSQKQPERNL